MPSRDDEPIIEIIDLAPEEPINLPWKRILVLLLFLFVGFLVLHNGVPLYTDWLWFREVGYSSVFSTQIIAKSLLFFAGSALFFVLVYGNIALARRLASNSENRFLMERFGAEWGGKLQHGLGRILLLVSLFFSFWAGRLASLQWANYLAFKNATPFGTTDPVFNNDIGFYVFRVPFWEWFQNFLFVTLLIAAVVSLAVHFTDRVLESLSGLRNAPPRILAHLLSLVAALALVQLWGTRLSAYDLLKQENGVFYGAGYADLHYALFALNAQSLVLVLAALASLLAIWKAQHLRFVAIAGGVYVAALVLLGTAYPKTMQKFVVEPNQFTLEKEFIQRNIAFTRKAYGLENVKRVDNFPADDSLNATQLREHKQTLNNIRLWDYNYLDRVYAQNQTVKTYYKFEQSLYGYNRTHNVDIDRYFLNGKPRQVMLAAREMDSGSLPKTAQTWQNKRLGYTHGYGFAMSPVNKSTNGLPSYFVQGIPPRPVSKEVAKIEVTRPEIYYGMLSNDYVFTSTQQLEFDYPATDGASGSQDHYAAYAGKGGIPIGNSYFSKLAFAARFGDYNILLAKSFKPETRVLFRRDVRERVQTIAPFLQFDSDPYLVVANGRMLWLLDGFTLSDRYPYSTPTQLNVTPYTSIAPNYIRNSVKCVVDAYDGTVDLYTIDEKDPIVQTYSKAFPNLLKPIAQMPEEIKEHLRYPEDLFRIQRSIYATYHVDDPYIFYQKEDAWAIPTEPNPEATDSPATNGQLRQMEPYFVVMRLPDEKQEEFLLISPMAPINREDKNMLGWMCARCDGDNYGELELYRFPQQNSVNGPSQIISIINSDSIISPQLSLLRQGGSSAKFGNLIVIPIGKSLLNITPLYIESTNSAKLPQLQKVVVVFGQRAVMENTLELALARLFPGYGDESASSTTETPTPSKPTGSPSGIPVPSAVRDLIERTGAQYDAAQQRLRAGDLAGYGAAIKEMEKTLNGLRSMAGTPTKP